MVPLLCRVRHEEAEAASESEGSDPKARPQPSLWEQGSGLPDWTEQIRVASSSRAQAVTDGRASALCDHVQVLYRSLTRGTVPDVLLTVPAESSREPRWPRRALAGDTFPAGARTGRQTQWNLTTKRNFVRATLKNRFKNGSATRRG